MMCVYSISAVAWGYRIQAAPRRGGDRGREAAIVAMGTSKGQSCAKTTAACRYAEPSVTLLAHLRLSKFFLRKTQFFP